MATYLTTTSELTSVADAIRTAGTTTEPLTFPSGFVSAIGDLGGGGGGDSQPSDNSIIFSDYAVEPGPAVFYKPTKATIKCSADLFNNNFLASAFMGSFVGMVTTVSYDVTGTITKIPNNYATNNPLFPYPPQSILNTVTQIGDNAYTGHQQYSPSVLETISLPNVQTIGYEAFRYNGSLQTLTIGTYGNNNLVSIGNQAFRNCDNLTTVYILEKPISSIGNAYTFGNNNANCVINVV